MTSTCCRTKQVFVSDCLQKRSLYAAGKWFPKFTDLWKLVLPSRTLFTAIEVTGFIEATLDGLMEVTFHAQAIVEFRVPCTGCCAIRCAFFPKLAVSVALNGAGCAGSVAMLHHLVPERIPLQKPNKTCFLR